MEALLNRSESEKEEMEEFLELCEEESEESEEESESEEEEEEFLFPRNFDFTEVCSCHECCTKINALKDFEKEFISKLKLVEGCWDQLLISKHLCLDLPDTIQVLALVFELLHDNLKKVHKEKGFSSIIEEHDCNWVTRLKNVECDCNWVNQLKNVYTSMNLMLFGKNKYDLCFVGDKPFGLNGTYGEGRYDEEGVRANRSNTIRNKIGGLAVFYRGTRNMDETHELLNKILDIENQHNYDRKFTKEIDLSTSKMYIENQIELLKKLPSEELEHEMKEVLDKLSPFKEKNVEMLDIVRNGVSNTRRQMFRTSCEFLLKNKNINCNVKGHDLSGLEITLDSLSNQMKLFNDLWNDYVPSIAHIITLCQQAEAEGFCLQGLFSPLCQYHH